MLLSDELLGHLIAVGQVDVLVGVPTLDNAGTVGRVAGAIHRSFATDLHRQRTVLLNCDGGSTDGTPEVVKCASLRDDETLVAPRPLRTIHRISAPYHGVPGKGAALRTLFAAAELLQARVLAVFDPDVVSIEPGWVARLVRPVLEGRASFVGPRFARPSRDGLLVTQVVRPLFGSAYGARVREPLASEFACSGAFAAHCAAQDVWDTPLADYGIDLWLTGAALSGGFACAEACLGARLLGARADRPGLPEVFRQVVGSLFECLEAHASFWLARGPGTELPVFGSDPGSLPAHPEADPDPMIDAFRSGVRDLAPVFDSILRPETLGALTVLAQAAPGAFCLPDPLWVSTIHEAAAAYHRRALHREHLVQALVPLYLGRVASFLLESEGEEERVVDGRLQRLVQEFEARKPELVERWTH